MLLIYCEASNEGAGTKADNYSWKAYQPVFRPQAIILGKNKGITLEFINEAIF